jgi:hypothetical protein
MQNFKKDQQIPLVQVTDPNTGQTYYAPQNVVYDEKNNNGSQYLRNVIVDQAVSASYFSGSITNAVSATSASYAATASYLLGSIASASFATSASYARTASYAQNIIISGSINNVDYIDFNTGSATPAWKSGRVFWDNTDGALAVYNAEADITLQVGQENWTRVSNRTGATILNGTVVRLKGAHGDVPEVELAQSIQVSGSVNLLNQILGVATHDIEDNSKGYITTQGLVRGLNTNAFSDGDTLFVGTGSAGVLQNTAPRAPFEIIPVGVCVKASPGTSGIIYVAVQEPIDFSDLSSALVNGTYNYGDLWTYIQSGSVGVWTHTNQLSGSYSITGSLRATSFTGSFSGSVTAPGTTTQVVFNNGGVLGANSGFVYSGSRVGIGTNTPSASLHISGASSAALLEIDSPAVNNILFVTGSGRVGLGTNLPITTLDISGSGRFTNGLTVTGSLIAPSITGSLLGTASFASTASFVTNLNQTVTLGNITSTPSNENTLNIYPPIPTAGTGEGGQLMLAASGGLYTSASMIDNYQNYLRILRGTNTGGSNAQLIGLDLQTGNLSVAGAVTPGIWTAGQVIKDTILSNTEVTISTTTIATSTSDTDFLRYDYTPLSSTSYLVIHYHLASYDFTGGTGNDSYLSRIKVDGTEITYGAQSTVNGFRTGVLFPLTGRYTNSSTATKTIVVAARRNSADDSITIVNSSTSMWLRITEIAR